MDIEKELFPNSGKLIIKGEDISAQIIDAELDPVDCQFHNDGCVQLDTNGFSYLLLTKDNLHELIDLINKSNKEYAKIFKQNE